MHVFTKACPPCIPLHMHALTYACPHKCMPSQTHAPTNACPHICLPPQMHAFPYAYPPRMHGLTNACSPNAHPNKCMSAQKHFLMFKRWEAWHKNHGNINSTSIDVKTIINCFCMLKKICKNSKNLIVTYINYPKKIFWAVLYISHCMFICSEHRLRTVVDSGRSVPSGVTLVWWQRWCSVHYWVGVLCRTEGTFSQPHAPVEK